MPSSRTPRLGRLFGDANAIWLRLTYEGMAAAGFGDVRPAHSPVLRNIDEGGTRAAELAMRAGMTKQSMAYLVSDLEKSGLVETVPDPSDGRARLVRLTARGREAHSALASLSRELEARLVARMGADSVERLRGLLVEVGAAPLDAD